jgi:outer membrane protein assembly factor BamE (lipoprotein component of BamABCDE complex)
MSKSEVTAIVGEPRSKLTDTDGNQVWEYRKNGTQGKGMKTLANVTSFGLTADTDAEYQDILTVTFKSGVVSKATYQENVHALRGPFTQ